MDEEGYIGSIDELAAAEARKWADSKNRCTDASLGNASLHQFSDEDFKLPVVVNAAHLLSRKFPPRERLLDPWLTSQSLSMLYAPRGVGKTHVALGIAYALASGGEFLGWKAKGPVPVLYLDGEMPGVDLQARLASIITSSETEAAGDALRFVTPDIQPGWVMPNLYQAEGQGSINAVLRNARVVIVDNISALCRGGKENDGESWQPVAEWSLQMRSRGLSVLFIHHAGKGGQQRGTSKREDILDTVISLRRPSDYTPDQGARFEVHFEKARALYGEEVSPFEAKLVTMLDGKQAWAMKSVVDSGDERILELAELGLPTREIAAEIGVNQSTVARTLKRLREEGRYTEAPKSAWRPKKQGTPELKIVKPFTEVDDED